MLRQRRIVQFFAESINIKQIYVADNLTLLDNITVANSSANIIVAKIYLVRKNFPVVEKGFEDTLFWVKAIPSFDTTNFVTEHILEVGDILFFEVDAASVCNLTIGARKEESI